MEKKVVIFISVLLIILVFVVSYTILVIKDKMEMIETTSILSNYNITKEENINENEKNNYINENQ